MALAENVAHFGGDTARTRCFLHIVNLVAKSLLKQFDVPKNEALAFVGTAEEELREIAQGLEAEDADTVAENGASDPNADDTDNLDGWVDEVGELSDEEHNMLQDDIRPIKFVLVKLCKLSYKIVHSLTLLLPEWKSILPELKLTVRIMPHDISTRWNSMFDMLEFALQYRKAIDTMTDKRRLGLGPFELKENE
ncbi:uncharacterized protein F5891DRAFT_965438 [Suillus fuscotomentosus]|uniref:Transposase n=1 Tax=Suillus fuscotomentosus TaxID=1912939 RepID=A0AAD4DQ74_9AGAM|nr:uncharacterized protein F5891DRAFT_965438 [Suillus fuscotomentosus]KAG1889610.1 hypothetical protein F5891DRAFT_965438 [Suillus fuscotomentosus]